MRVFLIGVSKNYFLKLSKFFLWPSSLTHHSQSFSSILSVASTQISYTLVSYLLVDNGSKTLFLQDCQAELRWSEEKISYECSFECSSSLWGSYDLTMRIMEHHQRIHCMFLLVLIWCNLRSMQNKIIGWSMPLRKSFSICQFQCIDWFGNEESLQICQFSVCCYQVKTLQ